MPPFRTYVYIDGFNLYYGQVKKTPYKWLNLDSMCRSYLNASNNDILKIKYFTPSLNRALKIRTRVFANRLFCVPSGRCQILK
jgi:hypothetical protein